MSTERSGIFRIETLLPGADRRHAINASGNRWCTATIAAALSLPADIRETVDEWRELIDRLDRSIKSALLDSARERWDARHAK